MNNANQCIDVNKGFRRLGNFSLDPSDVYTSYTEASEYALSGKNGGSSYVGQLIKVLPENDLDDPQFYIVNSEYRLQSPSEHIVVNNDLSVPFSYKSPADGTIMLPEGFILNSITVKIDEAFRNDNAVRVALYPYSNPSDVEYIIESGLSATDCPNVILTDEDDSEFTFSISKTLTSRTVIAIYLNRASDLQQKGTGFLKIN